MPLSKDITDLMQQNESLRSDIKMAAMQKCMNDVVVAIEALGVNGIDVTNLSKIQIYLRSEISPLVIDIKKTMLLNHSAMIKELQSIRSLLTIIAENTQKANRKKAEGQK